GRALDAIGNPSVTMSLPVPLVLRGERRADTSYPSWIKSLAPAHYDRLLPLWASDPDLAAFGAQIEGQKAMLSKPPEMWVGETNSLQELARQAAERLSMPDGPRVAVLDHVGFDSHSNQPGFHSLRLREVDEALGMLRDT